MPRFSRRRSLRSPVGRRGHEVGAATLLPHRALLLVDVNCVAVDHLVGPQVGQELESMQQRGQRVCGAEQGHVRGRIGVSYVGCLAVPRAMVRGGEAGPWGAWDLRDGPKCKQRSRGWRLG